MIEPIDRLKTFLALNYPAVKFKDVRLHYEPGRIKAGDTIIDIRGVGYPKRIDGKWVPINRLWNELHDIYSERIEVLRTKHGHKTKIDWEGRSYILDHNDTFKRKIKGAV